MYIESISNQVSLSPSQRLGFTAWAFTFTTALSYNLSEKHLIEQTHFSVLRCQVFVLLQCVRSGLVV
jgi:hypothetical protein